MTTRVLVGDEDPFNLRLLEEVCDAAGYSVLSAPDGPAVLDVVARERPDLILVDARMPRLDGFEILRILKNDENLRDIPVLIVTPESDVESRSRAIALGAEDYVSKPYRVFEVQQRLRNALRASQGDRNKTPITNVVPPPPPGTPPGRTPLGLCLEYEYTRSVRFGTPLSIVRVAHAGTPATSPGLAELQRSAVQGFLRACLRGSDQIFVHGDGEYVVILTDTDASGAETVRVRIWQRISEPAARKASPDLPHLQIGVATTTGRTLQSWEDLLSAATPKPKASPRTAARVP